MHDGCTGPTTDGKTMVNKVRMMGFAGQPMPMPLEINCHNCEKPFTMMTFEAACPECRMVPPPTRTRWSACPLSSATTLR